MHFVACPFASVLISSMVTLLLRSKRKSCVSSQQYKLDRPVMADEKPYNAYDFSATSIVSYEFPAQKYKRRQTISKRAQMTWVKKREKVDAPHQPALGWLNSLSDHVVSNPRAPQTNTAAGLSLKRAITEANFFTKFRILQQLQIPIDLSRLCVKAEKELTKQHNAKKGKLQETFCARIERIKGRGFPLSRASSEVVQWTQIS